VGTNRNYSVVSKGIDAHIKNMSATGTNQTWFDSVGDFLTRLTLDLRSAIQHSKDSDSRMKAFALLHMSINVSQILASGVWGDPEEAAHEAASYIVNKVRQYSDDYPEWVNLVASSWQTKLENELPAQV